jgi:hypothetical protein
MNDIRVELLEKVAEYDGTEYGEMLGALLHLERYEDYMTDDLRIAIDKEIQVQYEYCEKYAMFEEEEETVTRKVINMRFKDE